MYSASTETLLDCLQQAKQAEKEKQQQQAIALYSQAIEIDPNNLEAIQGLGQ